MELISIENLNLTKYSNTLVITSVLSEGEVRIAALSLRSRHREMLAAWALPVSLCACFFISEQPSLKNSFA